ncbi:threonine/serine exporter family protein [Cohnella hongkongensis]|uniref:Threonine/serine exporter family protein n=1 Tax=Cohnella hongkongensis TaxID=178337 RepID=A0ABV9FHA9_9BACL
MTIVLEQLATSFIASAAFGLIFNVPKRALVQCGAVGMLGWILYAVLTDQAINAAFAALISAGWVAVLSQIMAKLFRMPVIVFTVSGIIPLVPGGLAYNAMRSAVESEFDAALQLGMQAFMISGAIAMGLVLSEVINRAISRARL